MQEPPIETLAKRDLETKKQHKESRKEIKTAEETKKLEIMQENIQNIQDTHRQLISLVQQLREELANK